MEKPHKCFSFSFVFFFQLLYVTLQNRGGQDEEKNASSKENKLHKKKNNNIFLYKSVASAE